MRETKKVGKRLPTDEELEGMKPEDFTGLLMGFCNTNKSFPLYGLESLLWTSDCLYGNALFLRVHNGSTSVGRNTVTKDCGFSVRCVLETQKTEQCFCPSYMNDDNILVDCTCGKCEIGLKYPKKEVQDCFTCPHCEELIFYKSKNE